MALRILMNGEADEEITGAGDFGLRRVYRGEGGEFEENAEYSLVLPEVDKVAIMGLTAVELAAILTQSPVWTTTLHLATVGAIAALGGYDMLGRRQAAANGTKDGTA